MNAKYKFYKYFNFNSSEFYLFTYKLQFCILCATRNLTNLKGILNSFHAYKLDIYRGPKYIWTFKQPVI